MAASVQLKTSAISLKYASGRSSTYDIGIENEDDIILHEKYQRLGRSESKTYIIPRNSHDVYEIAILGEYVQGSNDMTELFVSRNKKNVSWGTRYRMRQNTTTLNLNISDGTVIN